MAEKRMFAKTIIDSDEFLEMPVTSQCLYFHLSMRADDDGFINKPKAIMRILGCKDDDIKVLFAKKFVIPFESGVVVIKHWRINNYIRKDTYKETNYKEEKALLELDENESYRLSVTSALQVSDESVTQIRLDKNSIDKNSKESRRFTPPTLEEINQYINEKNLNVDGEHFYNYFTEGNWIDSKGNKVKNWKQKLMTWSNHNQGNRKPMVKEAVPVYDSSKNPKFSEYDEKLFEEIMERR